MTIDSDTIKSYLVANVTIIWTILNSILLCFFSMDIMGTESIEEGVELVLIALFLLFIAMFCSLIIRHFLEVTLVCGIYQLSIIAISVFFLIYTIENEKSLLFFPIVALLLLLLSLWIGICVGRYAYTNFDEIVSRRYFYRNSNASVFEDATKYAINRGVVVCTCVDSVLMIIFIWITYAIISKSNNPETEAHFLSGVKGFFNWISCSINESSNQIQ